MATASNLTMLREISAAGDRGRTGALDVEWDGAHVTLFFMFGHPSHVVFETDGGRHLVGEPALEAFVAELPDEFRVAPWRRAMVTDDTLHFTAEDLMGLFQRRNASVESNGQTAEPPAPAPPADAPPVEPSVASPPPPAVALAPPSTTEQPPFGLHDFPLLPMGTTLWTDAAANVIDLEPAVPRLPNSLIVLSGPTCRGAALIVGGRVTDAVWVNPATGSLGAEAAHAVMNSLEGTLTAYRADDPRVLSALPMLWRAPRLGAGLPGGWLHTEDVVAEVRTSERSCCLVVDSADPGVALFSSGELVAVYTAGQRWPATSMAALRGLLHEGSALVTVLGELPGQPTVTQTHEAPAGAATQEAPTGDPPVPATADSEAAMPEAAATEAPADAVAAPTAEAADTEMAPARAAEPVDAAEPEPVAAAEVEADGSADTDGAGDVTTAVSQSRGRGRRGRGKRDSEMVETVATAPAEVTAAGGEPSAVEPDAETVDGDAPHTGAAGDTTTHDEAAERPASRDPRRRRGGGRRGGRVHLRSTGSVSCGCAALRTRRVHNHRPGNRTRRARRGCGGSQRPHRHDGCGGS